MQEHYFGWSCVHWLAGCMALKNFPAWWFLHHLHIVIFLLMSFAIWFLEIICYINGFCFQIRHFFPVWIQKEVTACDQHRKSVLPPYAMYACFCLGHFISGKASYCDGTVQVTFFASCKMMDMISQQKAKPLFPAVCTNPPKLPWTMYLKPGKSAI